MSDLESCEVLTQSLYMNDYLYLKNRDLLKTLYRKKSAYIKQSHEEMIKELIRDSSFFVVEKMSFRGLQKKAKKTERSEKTSDIRQKDGTTKQIHKYKRKKRFGKSLNNRAPAEFIEILTKKAELYGGAVYKVDTMKFKASQYDHVSDTYTKHSIHDRERNIDGNTVQRDLYSALGQFTRNYTQTTKRGLLTTNKG